MQSLEARKAQRLKQREAEAKQRENNPLPGDTEEDGKFNVDDYVAQTVGDITAQLSKVNDEQLDAIEAAEKAGKGRVGVMDAVKSERERRAAQATGWNANAG